MKTVFTQLETTEGLTLYLLTVYSDGDSPEFRLTLTDGCKVWKNTGKYAMHKTEKYKNTELYVHVYTM